MSGEHTSKFVLECAAERSLIAHHADTMANAIKAYAANPNPKAEAWRNLVRAWEDYVREVRNVPVISKLEELAPREGWRSS